MGSNYEDLEPEWQAAILQALVDGNDPMTGEALEPGSPCLNPKVRAALRNAVLALEKKEEREQRLAAAGGGRTGEPWNAEEDRELREAWDRDEKVAALAEKHGRSPGAIRSRLKKLGLMAP